MNIKIFGPLIFLPRFDPHVNTSPPSVTTIEWCLATATNLTFRVPIPDDTNWGVMTAA
jgi:hypothetical protein